MESSAQLVILAGLGIGLVYGAVGLLSGFCLMSSMRGYLAEGDGRLVRTYALAIAVAIAASQSLDIADGITPRRASAFRSRSRARASRLLTVPTGHWRCRAASS